MKKLSWQTKQCDMDIMVVFFFQIITLPLILNPIFCFAEWSANTPPPGQKYRSFVSRQNRANEQTPAKTNILGKLSSQGQTQPCHTDRHVVTRPVPSYLLGIQRHLLDHVRAIALVQPSIYYWKLQTGRGTVQLFHCRSWSWLTEILHC